MSLKSLLLYNVFENTFVGVFVNETYERKDDLIQNFRFGLQEIFNDWEDFHELYVYSFSIYN